MSRPRPIRRWQAMSKPQRIELYVRWSLYIVAVAQPLLALGSVAAAAQQDELPAGFRLVVLGMLVAGALNIVLFRTGLAAYLGRRPHPYGWAALSAALSVGLTLAAVLMGPPNAPDAPAAAAAPGVMATMSATCWITAAAIALPTRYALSGGVALVAALTVLPTLAGSPAAAVVGIAVGSVVGSAMAAAAARCSAWMAKVVWELDRAREAQARLAVAEERLRFSRDLHDVLGRNLATIALKSELAVQLARRQRPEAVDQMTEVQRIAQDSQREVREVVRGYRTVELHTELIGAASVLRAANVDCRTELSGADALPAEAQSVLGWVVREAATNVLRHSEAANCTFRLRVSGGAAVLEVENDGVPAVPPARTEGAGSGLRGLRERLAAHGGTLTAAGPGPGRFRVTAELPMAARESVA
ncbi:sensor histidine kinase [Kitasatospora cheerisanensis]|uniref:Putative two-component system sensor kinase n=1 Tax=Kitasatospora cheerisanensis KCTC 2395 TaxID=1348663 RepID=A0A066YRB9_9ACTN|nr:histidine kinase [Kitasatospora cheerisanensis]KDN84098.1 putative two-component system sensor kinase [Kitasatospora cheerisanensis KCTC 2395]